MKNVLIILICFYIVIIFTHPIDQINETYSFARKRFKRYMMECGRGVLHCKTIQCPFGTMLNQGRCEEPLETCEDDDCI